MILVAGATGFLGGEVCRRLAERGKAVRALVRSTSTPEAVGRLHAFGVQTIEGDLKDPSSLPAACAGVRAVISTATSTHSRQDGDSIESTDGAGQRNLVRAARDAGVERFTYVSYSGGIDTDDPLTRAKRSVEREIQGSGMTYTVLRPSFFMEVWLSPALGFDYPNAKATIFGDGTRPVSWISLADVASFAVETLDHPAARNAVLELGGPEALSPLQVVALFEEIGGRSFERHHVPEDQLRTAFDTATDSLPKTFAALQLNYAGGDAIPMEETHRTYGIQPTSVRDYASRVLSTAQA
ncbi:MAG TPA: SDR family oxidoreductase [Vicinamibacterales bacterium]